MCKLNGPVLQSLSLKCLDRNRKKNCPVRGQDNTLYFVSYRAETLTSVSGWAGLVEIATMWHERGPSLKIPSPKTSTPNYCGI